MGAQITGTQCPEDGVDQDVQADVGIGVAGKAAVVRYVYPAQGNVVAVGESMGIKAVARTHLPSRE